MEINNVLLNDFIQLTIYLIILRKNDNFNGKNIHILSRGQKNTRL